MKKLMFGLVPLLAVAAFAAVPTVASAHPQVPAKAIKQIEANNAALLAQFGPGTTGGVSPLLCEYSPCGGTQSAMNLAVAFAYGAWGAGGVVEPDYCTGPYGKGNEYETQWACYGFNTNTPNYLWQVNEEAYGHRATYWLERSIYIG
jgi:hypothetical protein